MSDYDGKIVEQREGYAIVDGWNIDFAGSAHVGYLPDVCYNCLVAMFGEPVDVNGVHIDRRWHIKFDDGVVATVFNYKDDGNAEDLTNWNVGGFKPEVAERVKGVFEGLADEH